MTDLPADDWIMISALQHCVYCPRQFAIIHVENYWKENFFTTDGRRLHDRVDLPGKRRDSGRRVAYALPVSSAQYGVTGIADAVEFFRDGSIVPVEYKRGKEKADDCDLVQVCAQAFCLEEMMRTSIPKGCLFYFETRERIDVPLDSALRMKTADTIRQCGEIISGKCIPVRLSSAKCRGCSLREYCMPPAKKRSARDFLEKELEL